MGTNWQDLGQHKKRDGPSISHSDLTPTLVVKLRAGDNGAALLLEQLYRDALVRFAWGYLENVEDARDAVGDVFYRVLVAKRTPENFRAWIYRTTRNHCLNLLRGKKRRRDGYSLKTDLDLVASATGNLTRLGKEEERERLLEAFSGLSESHQEILRLRYTEGLSRREVSEVLGVPVSTVKSRLFEGLKRIRASCGGPSGERVGRRSTYPRME